MVVPATSSYIGRFAPSPSGPLHLGSLLTAVASYLDARANQGTWLVRMEDLDPAREPPGVAGQILDQLTDFGLAPDQAVLYQSARTQSYRLALQKLEAMALCYACDCSRQLVREAGPVYPGTCRARTAPPSGDHAIRIMVDPALVEFEDLVQGTVRHELATATGDFILRRRDGLYAYQLAVVVDDAFQGVSHVIRGYDLIDSTPRQLFLQRCLGLPSPRYGHVPVIINQTGQKLSKQHFAQPLDGRQRKSQLFQVLGLLGMGPPASLAGLEVVRQLEWAVAHWDIQTVPKLASIPQPTLA